MHPFHKFISVLNLTFGAGALISYFVAKDILEKVLTVSIIGGYIGNVFAVLISIILTVLLAYNFSRNNQKAFIKSNWLGLFNGFFVIVFWCSFILISSYIQK